MGVAYLPILFAVLIAVVFSLAFVGLSKYFGPQRPTASKEAVYECGVAPVGSANQRFSVKFYLTAVLFILFDLEAVFLYPWAVVFRDYVYSSVSGAGIYIFTEMFFFLGVLFLGWYYVVKRGALDWD
ncbi:NADH-quinone oxidoreductase subunit A [Myxococcota bacterium]|nr:NADH-quinone oxidoreductase subunit A [Myxococcota bacterium]